MKIILTESQLDRVILREEETCDVFTNQTTAEDYDDILSQDPHRFLRTMEGKVVQMSPDEYFSRIAQLQDTSIAGQYALLDKTRVRNMAWGMKDGHQFDLPYINYNSGSQEGRHRVAAAKLHGCSLVNIAVFNKQGGEDPHYEGWDEQPEYTLEDLEDKLSDVFLSDEGAYITYISDWTHPRDLEKFLALYPESGARRDLLYYKMGATQMNQQTNDFEFDIDHFVLDEDHPELTTYIWEQITSVVTPEELEDMGYDGAEIDFSEAMNWLLNIYTDTGKLKPLYDWCYQMTNSVFAYGYLETNREYFETVADGYKVRFEKSVIKVYSKLKYHFDPRIGSGKELLIENDVQLSEEDPYMPESHGHYLLRAQDVKSYLQQYPIS